MNTSEDILVIFLSTALAVFLLVGIIAVVKIIQILNHVKSIIEKADRLAEKAEEVGEFFQKAAGPATVAKLIGNIVESFREKRRSKRG